MIQGREILRVQLFAGAREVAGSHWLEVEVELPCSVATLRKRIQDIMPSLEGLLLHSRIAIDRSYSLESDEVHAGSEIAIIPPVSGG